MKPFSPKHRYQVIYQFLAEAQGDCSVLIDLGIGIGVYVHFHYLPLFRSLYGPIREVPSPHPAQNPAADLVTEKGIGVEFRNAR